MFERESKKTSGLDPSSVGGAQVGSNTNPLLDPQIPIVSQANNRLVLDIEGFVANRDGTCVFLFPTFTVLKSRLAIGFGSVMNMAHTYTDFRRVGIQTIQPVDAILPRDSSGALSFTSNSDPATGRAANQGKFYLISISDI